MIGGPPLGLTAERLSIRAALLGAAAITIPAVKFLAAAARTKPRVRVRLQSSSGHPDDQ
ncbi:hypothetical protein [Acrocarpospora corrugata]|uniref:hypothetical protein n=1 Tax=Acrocarpospora corrugata TaxID=35763 RepID=UPI0012D2B8AE|nr:hypothetical protein [Acrocarpospora corrugata]